MKNIAIVVVAYNRVNSLARLLGSLEKSYYYDNNVSLIISIDKSENTNVATFAHNYEWSFGEKKVIEHPSRLGLRKHVLYCGNLSKNYEAIVVLEDDILVSPYFFKYVCQTVDKYYYSDEIAGISLYTHLWNIDANRPFTPQHNGFDVYFLQYAQSWGQVWTNKMWQSFYDWYLENESYCLKGVNIPDNVKKWPDSSWLKFFISYVSNTNRYFVYPYISLSTNFTDIGTHNKVVNTSYQVPLLSYDLENYRLPDFTEKSLKYDAFFECENLKNYVSDLKGEICVDIYGRKNDYIGKNFLLTTKSLDYKIIRKFALQLKPHELNVMYNIEGTGVFLYDLTKKGEIPSNKMIKNLATSIIRYDARAISNRQLLNLLIYELKQKFKKMLKLNL